MPHHWTENDDLAALYVNKFGLEYLPYTIEEIATRKDIKVSSFKMRIRNVRALAGKGGLSHYARQTKDIYERYQNLSETELRRVAFPEL